MKKRRIPNDPMPTMVALDRPKRGINPDIVARSRSKPQIENAFVLPSFPPNVLPPGAKPLAMDAQIIEVNTWAAQSLYSGAFNNGATFLGYPYLSQLAQIPEYRKITETIAMHMTRKFITLQAVGESESGESNKTQKIKEITDDLEKFNVRDVFRRAAEVDGYFGRAHLYIDFGYADRTELKMPIGNGRDDLSRLKVKQDSLKGFKIIEPVWTYPGNYNSNNPMTMDWYNPQTWFVMQQEIHVSRCLRMVGREVPDLLKPAYSFGGLSLSQMAKPYVDNWLRTRQSVADLIWSFSVSGVSTDLSTLMSADGNALFDRAELFNNLRNNRGMMMLNKDSEEFFQVNTPLGTLDKLQAQAQEHMASVSSIPLVFLLGITPSGLNASSEGEIRAFYDFIHAFQTKFFTEPLTRVIDFIQLNRYGHIDPEITFIYEPLWSMTEKEQGELDKVTAETDDLRINGGIISPLEARKRVANAPDTPYAGLDVTVLPMPPGSSDTDADGDIDPDDSAPPIGGQSLDPGRPEPPAQDEWQESQHPRGQPGNAGQFGSGGGGGGGSKAIALGKQITSIINKPAGISGKYRQGIQALLKDPGTSSAEKTKLKEKLVESYAAKAVQLQKKGDPKWKAVAYKAEKLAKSLGTVHIPIASTSAPTSSTSVPTAQQLQHTYTAQELEKAKKSVKLQLQYVPGAPQGNVEAQKLVDKFNSKWEGKNDLPSHLLEEKIDDFKSLTESMKPLQSAEQKAAAEYAAKNKEKQIADAKAAAEAAAEEKKKAAEKFKEQHEEITKELGITDPQELEAFDSFVEHFGGVKSAVDKFKSYQKQAQGIEGFQHLSGFEMGCIKAYTGPQSSWINDAIIKDVMTPAQFMFEKVLNKALDKLPKKTGLVKRGLTLDSDVLAKMTPGKIWTHRNFASSNSEGWGGNTKLHITATGKGGAYVGKVSSHPHESETLFKSNLRLYIDKVEKQGNVTHVHCKEM